MSSNSVDLSAIPRYQSQLQALDPDTQLENTALKGPVADYIKTLKGDDKSLTVGEAQLFLNDLMEASGPDGRLTQAEFQKHFADTKLGAEKFSALQNLLPETLGALNRGAAAGHAKRAESLVAYGNTSAGLNQAQLELTGNAVIDEAKRLDAAGKPAEALQLILGQMHTIEGKENQAEALKRAGLFAHHITRNHPDPKVRIEGEDVAIEFYRQALEKNPDARAPAYNIACSKSVKGAAMNELAAGSGDAVLKEGLNDLRKFLIGVSNDMGMGKTAYDKPLTQLLLSENPDKDLAPLQQAFPKDYAQAVQIFEGAHERLVNKNERAAAEIAAERKKLVVETQYFSVGAPPPMRENRSKVAPVENKILNEAIDLLNTGEAKDAQKALQLLLGNLHKMEPGKERAQALKRIGLTVHHLTRECDPDTMIKGEKAAMEYYRWALEEDPTAVGPRYNLICSKVTLAEAMNQKEAGSGNALLAESYAELEGFTGEVIAKLKAPDFDAASQAGKGVLGLAKVIEGFLTPSADSFDTDLAELQKADPAAFRKLLNSLKSAMNQAQIKADKPAEKAAATPAFVLRGELNTTAMTYGVVKGDTLSQISRALQKQGINVSVAQLQEWNTISDPRTMRTGITLRLSAPETPATETPAGVKAAAPVGNLQGKSQDELTGIAEKALADGDIATMLAAFKAFYAIARADQQPQLRVRMEAVSETFVDSGKFNGYIAQQHAVAMKLMDPAAIQSHIDTMLYAHKVGAKTSWLSQPGEINALADRKLKMERK